MQNTSEVKFLHSKHHLHQGTATAFTSNRRPCYHSSRAKSCCPLGVSACLVQRVQAPELDFNIRRGGESLSAQAPAVRRSLDAGAVRLGSLLRAHNTGRPSFQQPECSRFRGTDLSHKTAQRSAAQHSTAQHSTKQNRAASGSTSRAASGVPAASGSLGAARAARSGRGRRDTAVRQQFG